MSQLLINQNQCDCDSETYFSDSDFVAQKKRAQPRFSPFVRAIVVLSLLSICTTATSWCEGDDIDWETLLAWSVEVADRTADRVFDNSFDYDYIKSVVDYVFRRGSWTLNDDQIATLKQTYSDRMRTRLHEINAERGYPLDVNQINALVNSSANMFEQALDQFKGN